MSPQDTANPERTAAAARGGNPVQELGLLLAATGAVESESERLRMAVSALGSVVPCNLAAGALVRSEAALRDRNGGAPTLVLEGELCGSDPGLEGALRDSVDGLVRRVSRQGRLLVPDGRRRPESDVRPGPPFDAAGIRSLALYPLRTVESTLGFLMAARCDPGGFAPEEQVALQVVSEQLSMGIENLRLQRSLRRYSEELDQLVEERTAERDLSRSRLQVLLDVNNAVVSSLDRESLFTRIAESLQRVVHFDRASITLLDPGGECLSVVALGGPHPIEHVQPVGSAWTRHESHLWGVVKEGRPSVCRDLRVQRERTDPEERLLEEGIQSYVAVPLMAKDEVLGTLNLGSREPEAYGEEEAGFLFEVGKQVALAIDNMLAYEEIRSLKRRAELETEYLREEVVDAKAFGEIIGRSESIRRIERKIEQVAPTGATVLIQGESGTGNELVAREIHTRSDRSDGPMIKVNCASIPRELYESEFFGHVKGAFSGAVRDRAGRFAAADGGTLFLDEVGEIPVGLQSKLLRVLQDGTYQRVGEERTRSVDVRIVAATNRDLDEEVREGRFREDLFYRLNVFPVEVPPLRERKEDIPLLAAHFLEQSGETLDRSDLALTEANVAELEAYDWPGNVRELRNVIERAVITARNGMLRFDLPDPESAGRTSLEGPGGRIPGEDGEDERRILTEEELERLMRRNIEAALERSEGKIYGPDGAAEMLGVPPTTLASRIESMGIER